MCKFDITQFVRALTERLEFSASDVETLCSALDKILENAGNEEELYAILALYDESERCDYKAMMGRMKTLAESVGVHEYTAQMLLYLAMAKKLRERYDERGIDEEIYYNSLKDIKYKCEECKLVKGIVGSFVASWFSGFYNLTRFALGRLQFEVLHMKNEYEVAGIKIDESTPVINIHIPRTGGRLVHEEVLASYAQAAEFFKKETEGYPTIFRCQSWMLFPWNMSVLAPDSNMAKFYSDFIIIAEGTYESYADVWRLFDTEYNGNPDDLPANTSLRRAYIERMKRGEPLGYGHGFIIYKT